MADDETPMEMSEQGKSEEQSDQDAQIVRWVLQCRDEAGTEKFDRMEKNKLNWDVFHMRHDFSHKTAGQSTETLSMQPMAVVQTSSFFQQALVDMGEWWSADPANPLNEAQMKISPDTIHRLTKMELEKAEMLRHVGLGVQSGLLGALTISKVHGGYEHVPKYKATGVRGKSRLQKIDKRSWKLRVDLIMQRNYYPDPTGDKLYEIEDMWIDLHEVLALASGEDAIYDAEAVKLIPPHGEDDSEQKLDERRHSGQNEAQHGFRSRVKLTEYWGTILDEEGKILHENCVCTVANDSILIRRPEPNPNWDQESPYVVAGIMEIPDAVWPKALMDAPTRHNLAANEIYNLLVDGGMRAVNGVGQLHVDWVDNPEVVQNGIKPGATLNVNAGCPPGAVAYQVVPTGQVPPDGLNMYNIINQEFNRAALTSDIRQGITPRRDVPATQIVETSNTITSVFQGMSKNLEQNWIQRVLQKGWMQTAQHIEDIDEDQIKAVLPEKEATALLEMSCADVFANTVQGIKFRVYGITLTLQKAQDVRKYTTLMQTIGASPALMESFTKKYSLDKFLSEIMRSLGLDVQKLEIPAAEQEQMSGAPQGTPQPQGPGGPDQMSQVTAPTTGSMEDQLGSAAGPQIPHAQFPKSRATPAGSQG